MQKTTAEILRKAKAHISDPAMWHKGDFYKGHPGKDRFEFRVQPTTCPACVFGAISAVTNLANHPGANACLSGALPESWNDDMVDYNDDSDTTHDDIMAWLDRAIAHEEASQ